MTVGCVAGDEETYDEFAELLDDIIDKRHGGYKKVRIKQQARAQLGFFVSFCPHGLFSPPFFPSSRFLTTSFLLFHNS